MKKEPWLINTPTFFKKHKKVFRKRKGVKKVMRKRRHSRRSRRNPMEELMIMNRPARSHRLTVFGHKGRVRVSRRSRLAPRSMGALLNPVMPRNIRPLVMDLAGVAVGFIAVRVIPKYILPLEWREGTKGIVAKVGVVLGMSAITGMVLKKPEVQKAVVIGGLLSIGIDLLSKFMPQITAEGLGLIVPSETIATDMIIPQSAYSIPGAAAVGEEAPSSDEYY